jgi:hypothetical protein
VFCSGLLENVQSPLAFVVVVPTFEKLPSNGDGSASIMTGRFALLLPFSFPVRVTEPPNFTVALLGAMVMFFGAGLAASAAGTASRANAAAMMNVRFMQVPTHERP